jgi:hypothetical protein
MAQVEGADERDEFWVNVISRIVEVEDPEWILENVLPVALDIQLVNRAHCIRLLCEIAGRTGASKGIELLSAANAILPLERWRHSSILSAIPLLDKRSQIVLICGVLRDLSKEGRVRQLTAMPHLLPIIAKVGGARAVTLCWEALWDATRIWP